MTMFFAEFVFSFELIVIALGLIVYYKAGEKNAPPLKLAAYVLIIGGVLAISCTSYFSFKYFNQGEFESSMPRLLMNGSIH